MSMPNFLIAGTARSGTTSLYYYLKQHPEIGFPSRKEPKYFSSLGLEFPHRGPGDNTVDQAVVRDFASYQKLFNGLERYKRVGEASSDYLFNYRHSAQAIRRTLNDIPIILCLRNPVDRAYSAYNNLVRDQREKLEFADALAAEESRLADNWDWMWAYKAGGLYADQVAAYQQAFSRVKVILFDDLVQDTKAVVHDLFLFLEVDKEHPVDTSTRYSHSGKARNKLIAFLSRRDNPVAFAMRKAALKVIPRTALEHAANHLLAKQAMNKDVHNELKAYFRQDILRLETLIGQNLERWK
jgi:hypothetical protein